MSSVLAFMANVSNFIMKYVIYLFPYLNVLIFCLVSTALSLLLNTVLTFLIIKIVLVLDIVIFFYLVNLLLCIDSCYISSKSG